MCNVYIIFDLILDGQQDNQIEYEVKNTSLYTS